MAESTPTKFFVYIIESPSSRNIYDGVGEGELIKKAVSLNSIPCILRTVVSKQMLEEALTSGLLEQMLKYKGQLPFIHLSAHGFEHGIELTDGTELSWNELKSYLKPINKAFQGTIFLCMSTCRGFNACCMSMNLEDEEFPFFAVIGNAGEPLWSETAVAYATFYHQVAMGKRVKEAVNIMKIASSNANFFAISSNEAKDYVIKMVKEHSISAAQAALEEEIEKAKPGETEKIKKQINKKERE